MRRLVLLVLLAFFAPYVAASEGLLDSKSPPTPPTPPRSAAVMPAPHLRAQLTTPAPAYSVTYQYDSLGRLITATKDVHASNFTYDAAGNRTVSSEQ